MRYNLFILSFAVLLATSCTQVVDPVFEQSGQDLFIKAQIESYTFRPEIQLNTTFTNTLDEVTLSSKVNTIVYVNDDDDPKDFRPLPENKSVWIAPAELEIAEGNDYRLLIDASELGFKATEASTRVPFSGNLGVKSLNIISNGQTSADGMTRLETKVTLNSSTELPEYYHLIPFIRNNDGTRLNLIIERISSNLNATIDLEHRHGILIDESVLDDTKEVSILLNTSDDIDIESLDFPFIYFDLKTTTKDYYLYNISISDQVKANASPFNKETLTYSNFSSGYGIFTIYTSKLDSIIIE
ncbi:MAG: DUF4249 family protein [Saprospiraceae bacterium]|nr:DUF4249 family protein [Saprospiraceae bacterium]